VLWEPVKYALIIRHQHTGAISAFVQLLFQPQKGGRRQSTAQPCRKQWLQIQLQSASGPSACRSCWAPQAWQQPGHCSTWGSSSAFRVFGCLAHDTTHKR
jgi:hypothetical protein